MNDSLAPKIMCPYFINQTKVSVSCEGIESDKLVQWFDGEDKKLKCIEAYCMHYPSKCPVQIALEKKYESTM